MNYFDYTYMLKFYYIYIKTLSQHLTFLLTMDETGHIAMYPTAHTALPIPATDRLTPY